MKRFIGIITLLSFIVGSLYACKKANKQPIGLGTETTMSSPILQLNEVWSGTMVGLIDVSTSYDSLTKTVNGTVKNISSKVLCWTLAEPHMKMGTQTAGELGPGMLGDLQPGQQVSISMSVLNDPKYTGYTYDGYLLHMEVYDCNGGIPLPYPGGM